MVTVMCDHACYFICCFDSLIYNICCSDFRSLSTRTPRSFSTSLHWSSLPTVKYLNSGLFLPTCKILHLSLLNLISAPMSQHWHSGKAVQHCSILTQWQSNTTLFNTDSEVFIEHKLTQWLSTDTVTKQYNHAQYWQCRSISTSPLSTDTVTAQYNIAQYWHDDKAVQHRSILTQWQSSTTLLNWYRHSDKAVQPCSVLTQWQSSTTSLSTDTVSKQYNIAQYWHGDSAVFIKHKYAQYWHSDSAVFLKPKVAQYWHSDSAVFIKHKLAQYWHSDSTLNTSSLSTDTVTIH